MKSRLALFIITSSIVALSAAVVMAQPTPDAPATTTPSISIVIQPDIFVRSGPGRDYTPVGRLVAGDSLIPLRRNGQGDWVLIVYRTGFGWIRRDLAFWVEEIDTLPFFEANLTPSPDIFPTRPQPLLFATVTPFGNWVFLQGGAQSGYVRAGPGQTYLRLGQLFSGEQVEPVGRNTDSSWVLIRFGDGFGWIAGNIVYWVDNVDDLPVLLLDNLTPTSTFTPSATTIPTQTASATLTATFTITASATSSATSTPSLIPTATPSATATSTNTPLPTPTVTHTDSPAPSATTTPTQTASASVTFTPSPIPTATPSATATSTNTPLPTPTVTHAATDSPTPSATTTPTQTASATLTATFTITASATSSATSTASPIPTATPSATATQTQTPSATSTATPLPTATSLIAAILPSAAPPPTKTERPTATNVLTPTVTQTQSPVLTEALSPTSTDTVTATSSLISTSTVSPVPPSLTASTQLPLTMTSQPTRVIPTPMPPTPTELVLPTIESIESASGTEDRFSVEAVVAGVISLLILTYVGLFWRGLVATGRYAKGFIIRRCPVCERGYLTVETRQERLLGIPRPRRTVRCSECRSLLRETGSRRWRYAVDPIENADLYRYFNGQEVDEQTLSDLANQLSRVRANIIRPPSEPPDFVDDDQ